MERAVSLNMEHLDFIVEESWRWALSCTHATTYALHPT